MATLEALYMQDPFWLWLALGCLFVSLNLATGASLLMWPGIAAALVAVVELTGLRLGLGVETGLFAFICLAALAGVYMRAPRAVVMAGAPAAAPQRHNPLAPGQQGQTARLVGRIGRTSSEFVNGVGRVWIDGAEWGAEIDAGEEDLPAGESVRVVRVIGGIRLQVHALSAG